MARVYTVRIILTDGSEWYVPSKEFTSGGVSETPESVMGGYIRGTRGSLLLVNSLADFTGDTEYINPSRIVRVKISLTD